MKKRIWLGWAVLILSTPPALAVEYRLRAQDVLEVTVWQREDLLRVVSVESDGWLTFPLAGRIEARGKTVAELGTDLTERLSKHIPNPQVTVTVREYRGLSVTVLGMVKRGGCYSLAGDKNLLDVIAEAGGPSDGADLARVRIIRDEGSEKVDLRSVLRGKKDLSATLRPGDTVYVPRSWTSWLDPRGVQMALTLSVLVLQVAALSK